MQSRVSSNISQGKLCLKYGVLTQHKCGCMFQEMALHHANQAELTFVLHLFCKRSKYANYIYSCQFIEAGENVIKVKSTMPDFLKRFL